MIKEAIDDALDHPDKVETYSHHAQQLVRGRLTWDKTIGPLEEFCEHPTKRRSLFEVQPSTYLVMEIERALRAHVEEKAQIEATRSASNG